MMRLLIRSTWALLSLLAYGGLSASLQARDVRPSDLLTALWKGDAHFVQVGDLAWGQPPYRSPLEGSGWFAVKDGVWYVFNRRYLGAKTPQCKQGPVEVVARESHDHGATWSNPPVVVASPGDSPVGDGCLILDGSTFYDSDTHVWHMLAQCMDTDNVGGWGICHYTFPGKYPMERSIADEANPVIRTNSLWSKICSGAGKACNPRSTGEEGTPEILVKRKGLYYVTFHGWDPTALRSYRGVASTPDFHSWKVEGPELPADATLAPENCQKWEPGCVGFGEATTLLTGRHQYVLAEAPTKSLLCTNGQKWEFGFFRAPSSFWPSWKAGKWEQYFQQPLLQPSWPGPHSRCGLQYARWIQDGDDIYLVYEDWDQDFSYGTRRLMKLVVGASPNEITRRPRK